MQPSRLASAFTPCELHKEKLDRWNRPVAGVSTRKHGTIPHPNAIHPHPGATTGSAGNFSTAARTIARSPCKYNSVVASAWWFMDC